MLPNGHDLLRENICACTHECTHMLAKKKKKAGNPEEEIKSLIGAWEDTERVSEGMFVPG